MKLKTKVKTVLALGLPSLFRAAAYRLSIRLKLNPVHRLTAEVPADKPFFRPPPKTQKQNLPVNQSWNERHCYFDWFTVESKECPDWHLNPFNGRRIVDSFRPWWAIPDFDPQVGDIKTVWEPSRFGWLFGFAQQAAQGHEQALDKINQWLRNWIEHNPPYLGPNWKCGQEASIRVMHLAMTAIILDQQRDPEATLIALIKAHLKRIAPTITYAIAQDNNHGTSEAAALFIGGSWLESKGEREGVKWRKTGMKWLENRVSRLIEPDGSFSQYSVNYHRLMMDTFSMVEIWRRTENLPDFGQAVYSRLQAAANWLYQFTIPATGDAPNLGSNDGARLLPLTDTDYRDYRPAVQLSMALFAQCRAYRKEGPWNLPLYWLNIAVPREVSSPPQSKQFDNGGYTLLRNHGNLAVLRYPRFRFRPGHADALHLDFWLREENLLRDSGSFSYNTDTREINLGEYFRSTTSHNTIQFDDRDQMPSLGRFLFGNWLRTNEMTTIKKGKDNQLECAAGYTDSQGASHYRQVVLGEKHLKVEDRISGFHNKAVLRWRLPPGKWKLNNDCIKGDRISLSFTSTSSIDQIELGKDWESCYFMRKDEIDVLRITVFKPGVLTSVFEW